MLEIRDLTKVFVSDNNIDKKIALDKINLTINDVNLSQLLAEMVVVKAH